MDLVFQSESKAELVSVFIETSGINGSTKVNLDTRTKRLSVTKRMMSKGGHDEI